MSLPLEKKALYVPELGELATVLQDGLKSHFASVSVSVVDCPDLTRQPFTLAAPGLCGSPRSADVGGIPNIHPLPKLEKLMPNLIASTNDRERNSETYDMRLDTESGKPILEKCASTECALMVNLYCSEGKPGKVLEVKASKRTGESDFVAAMRKVIQAKYGDKAVGLGGTFLIDRGKAWLHVMPDFCPTPITNLKEVEAWLKFFEFDAPIVCLSVFYSYDPGLDLRIEHTHCFSHHGAGGHYHYDTTPEDVVYRGYFHPAEWVYRVDRPTEKWVPKDK